jgi:thioredoxin-like negative regulator of GroEL
LEALANRNPAVALRIVDVGSWSSPAAAQHGIRSLPTIWLYENGEPLSRDRAQVAQRLQALQ